MTSIIKKTIAALILSFSSIVMAPNAAALDNPSNLTSSIQTANGKYVTDMPRSLDTKFKDLNEHISDLRLQLYLGILGLFLLIIIVFFYLKWNMQTLSMASDNLKHRQDDLIKILQMNNGKLQKNINKLERSLYDLSEKQVKISKSIKKKDQPEENAETAEDNDKNNT